MNDITVFGNLGILLDNVVRKYHVETISKYSISNNPLFDVYSNMDISISFLKISGEYDILEIKVLRQNNNYGLEFVEQKYLKLMDEVNGIQSHLLISMDKKGKVKDILNFSELYDRWEKIKENLNTTSSEMAKIIKDGEEEYSRGGSNFAEQLNKTTLYKAMGLGLLSFKNAANYDNVLVNTTPSLLFPNVINHVVIERDDDIHYSDTPASLQIYKGVCDDNNAKMQVEFIKAGPFLKRQMGEYKFNLFCSVEKDDETLWPNSIELTMDESIFPVLADISCKIEQIEE